MKSVTDPVLLKDTQDLFARRHEAHMGTHLYADHGGKGGNPAMTGNRLWLELAENAPDYYLSREDNALLQKVLPQLAALIPSGLSLRDNGPGGGKSVTEKSVPLLKALQSSCYKAIDTSPFFAKAACDRVIESLGAIQTSIEIFDSLSCREEERDAAVCYFGGSTIGNIVHPFDDVFPSVKLASSLRGLAPCFGDYLLVSFDENQDEKSLHRAYSLATDFCLNALHRVAQEVSHEGFDPNVFEYAPVWNAASRQYAHFWRAREDARFQLGDETFALKRGERFLGLNSYKPSQDDMAQAAELAGLEVVAFLNAGSPLTLAVMKRPDEKTAVPIMTTKIQRFATGASYIQS